MIKKDRKRIAQLEAALRHIARQTSGYVPDSTMGCLHRCASDVLDGSQSMLAVRVVDRETVLGLDYGIIYSSCPPQLFMRSAAEAWCYNLNHATSWPNGNPGYRIVEIDGSEPVNVLTGEPT